MFAYRSEHLQSAVTAVRRAKAHVVPAILFFGCYPKFVNIGEGSNKDRPVNRELRLLAQLPLRHNRPGQSPHHYRRGTNPPVNLPEVFELLHLGQDLLPYPEKGLFSQPLHTRLRTGPTRAGGHGLMKPTGPHHLQRAESRSWRHQTELPQHPGCVSKFCP